MNHYIVFLSKLYSVIIKSVLLVFLLLINTESHSVEYIEGCDGKYQETNLSKDDLEYVLQKHAIWLANNKNDSSDGERANLCKAKLQNVNLKNRNLESVIFNGADLAGAKMQFSRLVGAILSEANLSEATLTGVNLTNANLSDTKIVRANMNTVVLRGAEIVRADFTDSEMYSVDLGNAVFETMPGKLPAIFSLAIANNLAEIRYRVSPHALFELRDAFKKAGLREREREVTYSIKKQEAEQSPLIERWFSYLLFDLTCQYGMSPGRVLYILLFLGILMSFVYVVAIYSKRSSGIWIVWHPDRVIKDTQSEPVKLTSLNHNLNSKYSNKLWSIFLIFLKAYSSALYFSILTTFHFGWRDLNVGNWIVRIQTKEYSLRPTGWVRSVSGIHSLFSLYMIALWVLTYFGRPFE